MDWNSLLSALAGGVIGVAGSLYVGHRASRDHLRQWQAECRRQEWMAITRAANRAVNASAISIIPDALGLTLEQSMVAWRHAVAELMAELNATIFVPKAALKPLFVRADAILDEVFDPAPGKPGAMRGFREELQTIALADLSRE